MDQQQEVDTTTKHAGKACFYGNVMMLGRRKNCLVIKLDGGGSKACSARHLRKTKPGAARMPLAALDTTPQAARRRGALVATAGALMYATASSAGHKLKTNNYVVTTLGG